MCSVHSDATVRGNQAIERFDRDHSSRAELYDIELWQDVGVELGSAGIAEVSAGFPYTRERWAQRRDVSERGCFGSRHI
jgi:hypothetical protein